MPHSGDDRLNQARCEEFLQDSLVFQRPSGALTSEPLFQAESHLGAIMVVLWLSVPTEQSGASCKPGF
jgi:hypothetical protein